MRTIRCELTFLLATLCWSDVHGGDADIRLGFTLVSEMTPDIDSSAWIDAPVRADVALTANMTLTSDGLPPGTEPQGWSPGVWIAGLRVESLSVEGTATATRSEGGYRDDNPNHGFFAFEQIDPVLNGGRSEVVQAVILSFVTPTTLPRNTTQVIGKIHCSATVASPGVLAFLQYESNLRGSGEPAASLVTLSGESYRPTLGRRDIIIGADVEPELDNCTDGIDNDRDGWTDCDDPGCRETDVYGDEICDDEFDNDGDVDCDDLEPDRPVQRDDRVSRLRCRRGFRAGLRLAVLESRRPERRQGRDDHDTDP